MTVRSQISLVLVVGIGLVSVAAVQRQIEKEHEDRFDEELLYLPNEKLLNHFTAGLSSVIADLLWIKTIKYTVQEFHNVERKYTWLEHMCQTVTRLDPHFSGAYEYSGMLLAGSVVALIISFTQLINK